MVMLFNATLNNVSVISWRSVLLVVEKVKSRTLTHKYKTTHFPGLVHVYINKM
jgi:hypothetical protein